MSWILPLPPAALVFVNHKAHRRVYLKQWERDNREKRNKYWREYYNENRETRRAYLNQKQREYRKKAA